MKVGDQEVFQLLAGLAGILLEEPVQQLVIVSVGGPQRPGAVFPPADMAGADVKGLGQVGGSQIQKAHDLVEIRWIHGSHGNPSSGLKRAPWDGRCPPVSTENHTAFRGGCQVLNGSVNCLSFDDD